MIFPNTRQLTEQQKNIRTYQPLHVAKEELALLKDQALMVSLAKEHSFAAARSVYEKGAHCQPFATLSLTNSTRVRIQEFTHVSGTTMQGDQVSGFTRNSYKIGTTKIHVLYDEDQLVPATCEFGGNPEPVLDGCLEGTGELVLADEQGTTLRYVYNPNADNTYGRTIQGLSLHADRRFRMSQHAPVPASLSPPIEYYGQASYADEILQILLLSSSTAGASNSTNFRRGNLDFSSIVSSDARAAAIASATGLLTLGHYLVRDLEMAVYQCLIEDSDRALLALDQAVVLYGANPNSPEHLTAHLADQQCPSFRTCAGKRGVVGQSRVNSDILETILPALQSGLAAHQCSVARREKERLTGIIKVPLVQAVLQSAYQMSYQPDSAQVHAAQAAVYVAALVPFLDECQPLDATILYDSLKVGHDTFSFSQVKQALERNYGCLKVSCSHVGGLWNSESKTYFAGAEPCIDPVNGEAEEDGRAQKSWSIMLGLVTLFILGFIWQIHRRRRRQSERHTRQRKSSNPEYYDDSDSDFSDSADGRFA